MSQIDLIKKELTTASTLLTQLIEDKDFLDNIQKAAYHMVSAIRNEKKIISCGNGGSHCDAMHFAEELSGRYREERRPLPAYCISDASHITCVGNDYGFDQIFSRHLQALGNQGDVLLAISTSGSSKNILQAVVAAKERQMTVVALTGKSGGKLATMADLSLVVPHHEYADRIQEIHIKIIHLFILLIEKGLNL